MSLIGDALKKARQEAARQDAQRQRLPYAVGAADAPDRRPSWLPLLAGLGAGCLIAALLLVLAWSAGWGPFARPAQVAEAAPAAPPPVKTAAEPAAPPPSALLETAPAAPPQAAPVQEPHPPPPAETRPVPRVETPAARPAPVPPPVEEQRAPSTPVPTAPVPTAPAPAAPARPAPATPPQGAVDLVDGHSYTGEVPVPGGGAVKLNGIAFSQDHPIAVLDGKVVEPGEIVQGFTIVAIEAGRVKLQGYGVTVFVSSR